MLSWLLLRGRCRTCAQPISARYPAVEAATGVLFAAATWWALGHDPALLPVVLYLVATGIALFMIDLDVKRLPDPIVLPSYVVVLVLLVVAGALSGEWPVARAGLSAVVWFGVFAVPWFVTAGRGMGFGDVKLAPVLGVALGWIGWGASLVGLVAGFAFGAVVGVALVLGTGAGGKTKVPFGPFMLTGAAAGLLLGNRVFGWYLETMGLA